MTLVAILISVLLEKFVTSLQDYRPFGWLGRYSRWLNGKTPSLGGSWLLLAIIAPLLLVVALILNSTNAVLGFLLGLVILVYSIGPRELNRETQDYLDACERGDTEGATLYAAQLTGSAEECQSQAQLNQMVTAAILSEANDRILAVLFWFLILGPVGALLFRLSSQLHRQPQAELDRDFQQATHRLYFILNWLPARIAAFSYALGGSMVDALHNIKNYPSQWADKFLDSNTGTLVAAGLGALQIDPQNETDTQQVLQALALSNRAIIIWISLIAVMTLVGLT